MLPGLTHHDECRLTVALGGYGAVERRDKHSAVPTAGPPRDVEALEDLLRALSQADDEESAWRITVDRKSSPRCVAAQSHR
jgi:hypothetical protein